MVGLDTISRIEAARKARCQSEKALSGMNERRIRTGPRFGSCWEAAHRFARFHLCHDTGS